MLLRIPDETINDLLREAIPKQIDMARESHYVDLLFRINGRYENGQCDWLKHCQIIEEPPENKVSDHD